MQQSGSEHPEKNVNRFIDTPVVGQLEVRLFRGESDPPDQEKAASLDRQMFVAKDRYRRLAGFRMEMHLQRLAGEDEHAWGIRRAAQPVGIVARKKEGWEKRPFGEMRKILRKVLGTADQPGKAMLAGIVHRV